MEKITLNCSYVGKCGGCSWGDRSHAEQLKAKLTQIQNEHPIAQIRYSPEGRVRDRVDLIWENRDNRMRLGLYGLDAREVVDLESCPMMTEALEDWFQEFRTNPPPIARGSVRLRVASDGERGVWLDFSNQDVKALFDQPEYLKWLSERAFVEIGQRRKVLKWVNDKPKLTDPELRPWFETYATDGSAIPLYSPVGGFSQVGFAANRALVSTVSELYLKSGITDWLELFSGNGNFALALASRGATVEAIELEDLAVRGMQRSLDETKESWRKNVKVSRLDVYLKTTSLPSVVERGLLVDPPRAGLREVLKHMEGGWRPKALLYVSCFAETFIKDSYQLGKLGYKAQSVLGVDQFPFSPHGEWAALFVRV